MSKLEKLLNNDSDNYTGEIQNASIMIKIIQNIKITKQEVHALIGSHKMKNDEQRTWCCVNRSQNALLFASIHSVKKNIS